MRSERAVRYLGRSDAGTLRRERISVFVSRPWQGSPSCSDEVLRQRFAAMSQGFERDAGYVQTFCQSLGGSSSVMGGRELAESFARFLNPNFREDLPFDENLSCLENFQLSNGVGVEAPQVSFYLNGFYHGVLSIQSPPSATQSGIIQNLTSLPLCDMAICVNVTPLDVNETIAKEEAEVTKLGRALRGRSHRRMEVTLAMRQERIGRLAGGASLPFRCQHIIRVSDKAMDGVQAKLSIVKAALLRMQSCRPAEAAFPVTARNYFRASTPGWPWDRYTDGTHYLDDAVVANLLPMSGSASESLGQAEAIYDNGSGGLLGISGFSGQRGADTPQHLVVVGGTGSGKSLLINDLLVQGHPHYQATAIIDNGNSYGGTVAALGGKTLIIEPNGEVTLNYLDTNGAPLTAEHLGDVKAILLRMCAAPGQTASIFQAATIGNVLEQFYQDWSREWLEKSPENLTAAIKCIREFERFTPLKPGEQMSFRTWDDFKAETSLRFVDFSDHGLSDAVSTEFLGREDLDEKIHRIAFALMPPDQMPTHTDLCEWLGLEALCGGSDAPDLADLSRLLDPWKRTGRFGTFFDGRGTFQFDVPLIHLELGKISEAVEELRSVAMILVCNQVRNALMRRPRSERKRVVFEEISAILEIPEGGRVVRDFCDRGRKMGIWVCCIAQQISGLAGSSALVSILGNAGQGIFTKQSRPLEAEAIAEAFRLPESTKETLLNLPNPSLEKGAFFIHCSNHDGRPIVRIGTNVCHPEMLALAGTSGEQFEQRAALLKSGENILEKIASGTGIQRESAQ